MKVITDPNQIDEKKWSDFVKKHPHGNIFQTPEMYRVYENTKNYKPLYLAVVDKNKDILGSLLVVIQKEHSGLLGLVSSRAIIWGGPLIKEKNLDILDFILSQYMKIIRIKAIYSQYRNIWEWSEYEKKSFKKSGFIFENHLDIIHSLTRNIDDQMMLIHKGRRKNIRRAIKNKVQFDEIVNKGELIDSLSLIVETYQRVKLPIPDISLFIAAFEILFSNRMIKFFKAIHNDKTIGVRFVLCYKNMIYDWFAGSSNKYLDKYPNDYLPWKVIQWGHINGYEIFDFGGAGKPGESYGVRDYKMKFGGELENFGRFEKIHKPFLFSVGKLGLKVLQKLS